MVKRIAPVQYFGPAPDDPDRFPQVQVLNPDGTPISREHPSAQNLPAELDPSRAEADEDGQQEGGQGGTVTDITTAGKAKLPKP